MPDWYPLMKAARWIGVNPWKLARKALVWQQWALAMEKAEKEAEAILKGGPV